MSVSSCVDCCAGGLGGAAGQEERRQPRASGADLLGAPQLRQQPGAQAEADAISGCWKSVLNAHQMSCLLTFSGAGRIHRHKQAYGLDKKYN